MCSLWKALLIYLGYERDGLIIDMSDFHIGFVQSHVLPWLVLSIFRPNDMHMHQWTRSPLPIQYQAIAWTYDDLFQTYSSHHN